MSYRPTHSEKVMTLPLACGWCGAIGEPDKRTNIITCSGCGKQTSAEVAEEGRTQRFEQIDKLTGWA